MIRMRQSLLVVAVLAALLALATDTAFAQSNQPTGTGVRLQPTGPGGPPIYSLGEPSSQQSAVLQYGAGPNALLDTPVSNLFPGGISTRPKIVNPVGNNPSAVQRGMEYFNAMNCVGCHAPNGGGMGRALSNRFFLYGWDPANIFITIKQGRPNGMPSWGGMLPDAVIWDLVAYVEKISQAPETEWGTTISHQSPAIEQVPAEYQTTDDPWAYTEPFGHGQAPAGGQGSK